MSVSSAHREKPGNSPWDVLQSIVGLTQHSSSHSLLGENPEPLVGVEAHF